MSSEKVKLNIEPYYYTVSANPKPVNKINLNFLPKEILHLIASYLFSAQGIKTLNNLSFSNHYLHSSLLKFQFQIRLNDSINLKYIFDKQQKLYDYSKKIAKLDQKIIKIKKYKNLAFECSLTGAKALLMVTFLSGALMGLALGIYVGIQSASWEITILACISFACMGAGLSLCLIFLPTYCLLKFVQPTDKCLERKIDKIEQNKNQLIKEKSILKEELNAAYQRFSLFQKQTPKKIIKNVKTTNFVKAITL